MAEFEWERLRRWPDAEAANLSASDAADRLILDTAAFALRDEHPADVVVIGDAYGALTLASARLLGQADASRETDAPQQADASSRADASRQADARDVIRVHQDPVVAERALDANAGRLGLEGSYRARPLDGDLLRGARVVLLRLPKSLDALDEIAGLIAAHADPEVTVFAGGMQKHMAIAMNDVLRRHLERVDVGLGRQKARVLTAHGPRRAAEPEQGWPRRQFHGDIAPGLWVCAHGGAFAGSRIDIGTRFLLDHLDEAATGARTVVDLACGTGVLASVLALRRPNVRGIASDQSAAAAASAAATVAVNGVAERLDVRRENAGESIPDAWADLVVLNPPFHSGTSLDLRTGRMLVAAAARILAPGGELWTVYNSHLDYRSSLTRLVGRTRQVDRNRKFTITASVKR
ncbi:class I SAM-dependent methyltransferase [Humibacter sp.]|uniref:class I SAM-dependent methyltransferase n=1 Tax=Humibacter sp. TaxID=1940291 RepID=UPI002C112EB8|nr:methyltransferase [Humibacter sp.]HVX07531.1 methyltransferase [Humibacter sp.]